VDAAGESRPSEAITAHNSMPTGNRATRWRSVVRLYGRQAIAHGDPTHGWDRQRELTFARQKELGVIPADAELTERHAEIPAWDDMAEELKPVLERQMEIYAGFLFTPTITSGGCWTRSSSWASWTTP
jgi:arylsulfatase A-like enzyme